ncbi:hypothetical protein JCM9492_11440 [Aquifex pyrophilus]
MIVVFACWFPHEGKVEVKKYAINLDNVLFVELKNEVITFHFKNRDWLELPFASQQEAEEIFDALAKKWRSEKLKGRCE